MKGVASSGLTSSVNGPAEEPVPCTIAHVEGASRPSVNGTALIGETAPLRNGDLIELAGTQMQFVQG